MKVAPRTRIQTVANVEEIHNNTSQEVITITADKLKLALMGHLDNVSKKNEWHMPLSLLIGVVLVFCSAEFKSAFGLSADSWAAIFVIFGAGCACWLLLSLIRIRRSSTLEELIQIIKNKQT